MVADWANINMASVSFSTARQTTPMSDSQRGDEEEDVLALERVELSDSEDDGFQYDEVAPSESDGDDESGDDLEATMASLSKAKRGGKATDTSAALNRSTTQVRPSVVDDYLRNFLIKIGMHRTLDVFNTEWYELHSKGQLREEDVGVVPDIYLRNEELDEQVKELRVQVAKMQDIASAAQGTWDKFRKERDFHRMHHKRVVQEKNRLMTDIKRLRTHYETYEPLIAELRAKYESAMKEKMLMRLERDRYMNKMETLEAQVRSMEAAAAPPAAPGVEAIAARTKKGRSGKHGKPDTPIPREDAVNPFADTVFAATPVERFSIKKTHRGHVNSISAVAFHPKKPIVATASDDMSWKIWSLPNAELVMSGEGHTSWISDVAFHPRGAMLATSSDDKTLKLWDFATASCSATFSDHTQTVWGVAFHHSGDFVVSCSMDHTSKLWDIQSLRCRQTFRGHVDSVNAVHFQPYTNNIVTGSGDKTVSLWDIRSGLCVQTFYGHSNSVNHVTMNYRGDSIASADADGVVRFWDVRMVAERGAVAAGRHPLNKVAFDRSGLILAAASDDSSVKLIDVQGLALVGATGAETSSSSMPGTGPGELRGHEDAVQSVAFDSTGKYLVSAGSDCTFRLWGV